MDPLTEVLDNRSRARPRLGRKDFLTGADLAGLPAESPNQWRVDRARPEVVRQHSPEVREVLRKASLSMESELYLDQAARARELIGSKRSEGSMRKYIMSGVSDQD
jgi:hypothetical protein